jgi:hypothetical protein
MEREHYSMPTVEDLKAQIGGATVMSKQDMKRGYHDLEIDKASRYIKPKIGKFCSLSKLHKAKFGFRPIKNNKDHQIMFIY